MWTYAHQGQHLQCYECETYECDWCRNGLHTECTGDPCQCWDDVCRGDERFGEED